METLNILFTQSALRYYHSTQLNGLTVQLNGLSTQLDGLTVQFDGLTSSKTTEIYTHIPTKGFDQMQSPLDTLDF